MDKRNQWDFPSIAEAMISRTQKYGVLPADVAASGLFSQADDHEALRDTARRMMITGQQDEEEPVDEGTLWDMFGQASSSSAASVLAQQEGVSPATKPDRNPSDAESSLPTSLRTIIRAAWAFARNYTYDLDPLHCGSLRDEAFCSVTEQCLVLAQRLGKLYGQALLVKMQKLDLNLRLLEACRADSVDYSELESLLQQGAEPLGYIEEQGWPDNLYASVIENLSWNADRNGDLFRITQLLLRYGMDISKPTIPYDNDEILNPIYHFCGMMRGSMMETLRLLLDHGLSAEDARWGWGQQLEDFLNVSDSLDDVDVQAELPHYVRKLMLTASYPHVLEQDEALRFNIWLDRNRYDLSRFREWDWYDFELDTRYCDRSYPGVARSVITIKEKHSGEAVWRFGVKLDPGLT